MFASYKGRHSPVDASICNFSGKGSVRIESTYSIDKRSGIVYYLNVYNYQRRMAMPRLALKDTSRVSLRIHPDDKALLLRAVGYEHTDLTDFVLRNAVQAAKAVIAQAEQVALSERDSLRVLDTLENPPAPNAKLLAAAHALPPLS
jgi:uncharacterized protein (DUF1778 family)